MKAITELEYTPLVGVDIAPDFIRVVELERIGADYHLKNFVFEPMPKGCMEDGVIIRPKEVGRAIKAACREAGITTRGAVAAVRGSRVVSRLMTLPAMPQDRLRRVIETEVNRYVVFGRQDKVVFYHPIEEFEEEGRRKVSVMLVVADKVLCSSYFQTLRDAGLNCVALDVSTFAMLRVLRNKMPSGLKSGSMMSVTYDFDGIAMNIFKGDTIRFSRFIKMNNLDPKELQNGFMGKFMTEMLLSIQFYQSEFLRGDNLKKIVLSLGATGGMSIYDRMSDNVEGIPVEVHAPFANIKINVKKFPAKLIEKVDYNFLTAVGLALRGQEREPLPFRVDLMPVDVMEGKEFNRIMGVFGIMLLVCLIALAGLFLAERKKIDKQIFSTKKFEATLKDNQVRLSALTELSKAWKDLPVEDNDPKIDITGQAFLRELQFVVPKKTQIIELKYTGPESIEVTGLTAEHSAITDFMTAMTLSKSFADPANTRADGITVSDQAQVIFNVTGRYVKK